MLRRYLDYSLCGPSSMPTHTHAAAWIGYRPHRQAMLILPSLIYSVLHRIVPSQATFLTRSQGWPMAALEAATRRLAFFLLSASVNSAETSPCSCHGAIRGGWPKHQRKCQERFCHGLVGVIVLELVAPHQHAEGRTRGCECRAEIVNSDSTRA